MNSIARSVYQELLTRLNQMSIRSNRYKMTVYVDLNPDQQSNETSLVDSAEDDRVFAFHIMFERNNPDSEWRLVTPLKFTE